MKMKTRIIQKVFVFLLITVGITYILWHIAKSKSVEPFVILSAESGLTELGFVRAQNACSLSQLGSNPVYMCPSYDTANDLLEYQDLIENTLDPNNRRLLDSSAAVCFPSINETTIKDGQAYYVCFTRPPPTIYDPNLQKNRYLNPSVDYDPTPDTLDTSYPTTCAAYQSATAMTIRSFSTTQTNMIIVSTTIRTIQNSYSTLGTIYTQNCATTRTNINQSNACTALRGFFDGIQGGTFVTNLQTTYSTIWSASSTMKGVYRNDILPSFVSLNCREPSLPIPAGL